MSRIVLTKKTAETVLLQDTMRSNTYIYTSNAGGIWVLSKLGRYVCDKTDELGRGEYHYGFIRVDKMDEVPTFCAKDDRISIEKAINSGRKVLEFDTFGDFMKWRLKID